MGSVAVLAARWRQRFPLLEPAGVLAMVVGLVVFLALADPNTPGRLPTCPFLAMTGYYCPGCGSMRAIYALAHLDLGTALRLNVMTVAIMIPMSVFIYVRWTTERFLGRSIRKTMAHPYWIWALFWGILAFWLLRNLPFAAILAPYGIPPG